MSTERFIASIDQGTSSSRVIVFSATSGEVIAQHQIQITPNYPASGWIEQDANELYETTLQCLNECANQIVSKGLKVEQIAGIGVTNQRETTVVWNRNTGKPLAPAIVWSDARTADLVKKFIGQTPNKSANAFQRKTGLPIHSYFSALKICWLLENVAAVAEAVQEKTLLAGTVDSWIIWRLTSGKSHVTDVTNASRTLLFNLQNLDWDPELCRFFGIDKEILPKVVSSSEVVGEVQDSRCKLLKIKICGILGDQQASLVGQTWATSTSEGFEPTVKVTYGTGAFMLWDIGTEPYYSDGGILTTVAFKMGTAKKAHYALEGAVAFAGATMNWLRKKVEAFSDYKELDEMSQSAYKKHKDGEPDPCYLVPAFSGLFCPWWQENARAIIAGLTADVERGDVVYAGLRSSVYQTYDVLRVATFAQGNSSSALSRPRELVVDGGMTNSGVLMQSLADILDVVVRKHNHSEMMTALGAAVAAALAVGIEPSGLLRLRLYPKDGTAPAHTFSSRLSSHSRQVLLTGWHAAVHRSLKWVDASTPSQLTDSLVDLLHKVDKISKKPHGISQKVDDTNTHTAMNTTSSRSKEEFTLTPGKLTLFLGSSLITGLLIGIWKNK